MSWRRGLGMDHRRESEDTVSPGAGVRPLGVTPAPRRYPNPAPLPSLLGTNFSLRELGLGEVTPPHGSLYRADIGLPHCGYALGTSSEADLEADAALSPEPPVRLWGRSTRSGRSSCLSSRANSNLTLTDTEHENTETGEWPARGAGAGLPGPGFELWCWFSAPRPGGTGQGGGKLLCSQRSEGRTPRRVTWTTPTHG